MSYLEYTVKTTPTGLRKMLYLNWPLIILLIAVASAGFLMLYSVAGGSFSPWAAPQMKRFALGIAVMMFVAMVPIWFWRNMSVVAYRGHLASAAGCGGACGHRMARAHNAGSTWVSCACNPPS